MIDVTASVEYDVGDVLFLSALSDELADCLSSFLVAAALYGLIERRSAAQGNALDIVDDLSIDVVGGAEHSKAGTLGCAA